MGVRRGAALGVGGDGCARMRSGKRKVGGEKGVGRVAGGGGEGEAEWEASCVRFFIASEGNKAPKDILA